MSNPDDLDSNDADITALLREAGARKEPSEEMAREVQAVVHAEWRAGVVRRQRRRAFVWAAVASTAALALGATITLNLAHEQGRPLATLRRAEGPVFVAADGKQWAQVLSGRRLASGEFVRAGARAVVQFDSGLELRIDRGTSFNLSGRDRLALVAGAIYVDAKPGTSAESFVVTTHAGAVRHLGTQYQVRLRADGIELSVREGRVIVESERGGHIANAGDRLNVSLDGSVQQLSISPSDDGWDWASGIAPPFAIENAPLSEFLKWVARETGRPLVYESPRAQAEAASVVLRGSVDGLEPEVALTAVLATTPLRRDVAKRDVLQIGFAAPNETPPSVRPIR